jgi:serine/threonine protein kinase
MIKGDILGNGAYGIVYSCKISDTGQKYAVKRNLADKTTLFLKALRELDLLTKLRKHPHIITLEYVSYKSPFEDNEFESLTCKDIACKHIVCKERRNQRDDGIHFIFEEASCNLFQYIKENKNTLDFDLRKRYMIQILLAVEYIHKHSIIHCDLKPQNILILEDKTDVLGNKNVIQICDFGLAVPYTYQDHQTPNVVTSWYRAPEIILGYPHYDYKSDIWSLGCIFFEMINGTQFLAKSPEGNNNLISKILSLLPEEIPMKTMRSLITGNKWRKIKLYDYHKVSEKKRKSWVKQLELSNHESLAFEEQAGSLELFGDLLDQMFQIDWDIRNNITECIDHPFFEDQKLLIDQTRKLHNPKHSFEKLMYIVPCQERIWLKETVNKIYLEKAKIKWFNNRVLFQTLRLFDSYMAGIYDDKDPEIPIFTKYETNLKFYSFLYLSVKYFDILDYNMSFNDVFVAEYRTAEAKLEIEKFEVGIIQKMEHNIYHISVYEAADNFEILMDDNQISKLLDAYLNINKPLTITPSDFVKMTFGLK